MITCNTFIGSKEHLFLTENYWILLAFLFLHGVLNQAIDVMDGLPVLIEKVTRQPCNVEFAFDSCCDFFQNITSTLQDVGQVLMFPDEIDVSLCVLEYEPTHSMRV